MCSQELGPAVLYDSSHLMEYQPGARYITYCQIDEERVM